MQSQNSASSAAPWLLERTVLPQHTDHAGVMWHGAYVAWLEEARVEALAQAGLTYAELSRSGLEMPVVSLAISYRQALHHGDRVQLLSRVLPRRGVKLPWQSRFLRSDGTVAAEASVELVLLDRRGSADSRRLCRRFPPALEAVIRTLEAGPAAPPV